MPTNHEDCLQFRRDFETKNLMPDHVGRIMVGREHIVRIWFSPKGLCLTIPQEAIDDGAVLIGRRMSENIELAGFNLTPE